MQRIADRDNLWDAIYAFARACGGDVKNYNTSHERTQAEKAIDNVLDSYQTEFDTLTQELGEATTRVREKEEALRDIGKASYLIKNTAHGDVLLLPGDLELRVTEGIKK